MDTADVQATRAAQEEEVMKLATILALAGLVVFGLGCAETASESAPETATETASASEATPLMASGWIVDEKCGAGGKSGAEHSDCAKSCIEGGEAAVLVTEDGKVHKITNQDKATPLAGQQVNVTFAEADGGIEIQTIEAVG